MAEKKNTLKKDLPSVMVRLYGVTAMRIKNLSKRTMVKRDALAQAACELGIAAVEKRFR